MTAPTIRQIRAGLGTRLDTISGLRVFSTVPGQFSPPAAIVGMPRRVQQETFRSGIVRYECEVWIVVARQADAQSEKALESYLDPTGSKSVRAAVNGDTTLDGLLGENNVYELSAEPTEFVFGTKRVQDDQRTVYIGLEFLFQITAPGRD